MTVYDLIKTRRSIRKFKQDKVPINLLNQCVDSARLAPTGANLQPLEFVIVNENLEEFFESIFWAGYLKDWNPKKENMPQSYIVVLSNSEIKNESKMEAGLAAQNIMLTALEKDIASCLIGAFKKEQILNLLNIPKIYSIEVIVALGHPNQESTIEPLNENVKYWMDDNENFHVPKKNVDEILHLNKF